MNWTIVNSKSILDFNINIKTGRSKLEGDAIDSYQFVNSLALFRGNDDDDQSLTEINCKLVQELMTYLGDIMMMISYSHLYVHYFLNFVIIRPDLFEN